MKGVKINNYIDNRIVLSSNKIKNQTQTLIHQNHHHQPFIIHHLNYIDAQQQQNIQSYHDNNSNVLTNHHHFNNTHHQLSKIQQQFDIKIHKKKNKKNKTIASNHLLQLKNKNHPPNHNINATPNKIGNKKNISNKKQSISSSPDNQSKKFKSNQKSIETFNKKSKSTIIKKTVSPSTHPKQPYHKDDNSLKKPKKKQQKKQDLIHNTINTKKKSNKKTTNNTNNTNIQKSKQIKKNISFIININDKYKKLDKLSMNTQRISNRPISKSNTSSSKTSKPISARQKKNKQDKIHSIKDNTSHLSKNLFYNLDHQNQHISLKNLLNLQQNDHQLQSALIKLQNVLNNNKSKKKLSNKLQFIAEKLQQFDNSILEKIPQHDQQTHPNQIIRNQTQSQLSKKSPSKQSTILLTNPPTTQQKHLSPPPPPSQIPSSHPIQPTSSPNKSTSLHQSQTDLKKIPPNQFRQQFINQQQQVQQQQQQSLIPQSKQNIFQAVNGNNQFQNIILNQQFLSKQHQYIINYSQFNNNIINNQQNPKNKNKQIQPKQNQKQQTTKQLQISQLKKFQQQSNIMFKKIKKLKNPSQPLPSQTTPSIQPSPLKPSISQQQKNINQKNLQINNYIFQKYPSLQKIKSPKLNTDQILQVLQLKQKIFHNKHQKLSQLVHVLHQKKLSSPKTYNTQISSLHKQQQQYHQILDNYRKHAQQFVKILSDIQKQKQQITNIDQLIRLEKWDQAKYIIMSNQKNNNHQPKSIHNTQQNKKINQQQQWLKLTSSPINKSSPTQLVIPSTHQQKSQKPPPPPAIKPPPPPPQQKTFKPSSHQPRGFDSNLFFIKQYCIALCQYVRDNYKQSFRKNISQYMSYNLPHLLKSYRINRDGSSSSIINSLYQDLSYHDIQFHNNIKPINKDIFNQFNRKYPSIKFFNKQQSLNAKLQGIFLLAIYDALNQSLSIQKPGSTDGYPLPWLPQSKHLKNRKTLSIQTKKPKQGEQQSQDLIFGIAIARIIQWGSCLCGFIPDTVELQNTQIQQQYVNHIRQTRTALFLQKMLIDQQTQMNKNQLEITQILLHLTNLIFQQLINQIFKQQQKVIKIFIKQY